MNPKEFEAFKKKYGGEFADHADDILPIVNAWRNWPWGQQRNFWATDADKCPRRMFLTMWNIPQSNPDLSDETVGVFAVGDKVEEWVLEKFKQMRGNTWEQVGGGSYINGLEEDLTWAMQSYGVYFAKMFQPWVTFRADLVFDDLSKMLADEVRRYVVEVKSIKDYPFKHHDATARGPEFFGVVNVPKEDNYLQICQYLYFLHIQDAFLLYTDKNDSKEKAWFLDLERAAPVVEDVVLPRFRELYRNYVRQEMPDPRGTESYSPEPTKKGDRLKKRPFAWCLYCPYSSMCWGLDGHERLDDIEQLRKWIPDLGEGGISWRTDDGEQTVDGEGAEDSGDAEPTPPKKERRRRRSKRTR